MRIFGFLERFRKKELTPLPEFDGIINHHYTFGEDTDVDLCIVRVQAPTIEEADPICRQLLEQHGMAWRTARRVLSETPKYRRVYLQLVADGRLERQAEAPVSIRFPNRPDPTPGWVQ